MTEDCSSRTPFPDPGRGAVRRAWAGPGVSGSGFSAPPRRGLSRTEEILPPGTGVPAVALPVGDGEGKAGPHPGLGRCFASGTGKVAGKALLTSKGVNSPWTSRPVVCRMSGTSFRRRTGAPAPGSRGGKPKPPPRAWPHRASERCSGPRVTSRAPKVVRKLRTVFAPRNRNDHPERAVPDPRSRLGRRAPGLLRHLRRRLRDAARSGPPRSPPPTPRPSRTSRPRPVLSGSCYFPREHRRRRSNAHGSRPMSRAFAIGRRSRSGVRSARPVLDSGTPRTGTTLSARRACSLRKTNPCGGVGDSHVEALSPPARRRRVRASSPRPAS